MARITSYAPIAPERPGAIQVLVLAALLLIAATGCRRPAPPSVVTQVDASLGRDAIDVPDPFNPGKRTVRAELPSAAYVSTAARVTLRFNDAPLATRGGTTWGYTVAFTLTPTKRSRASAPPVSTSLTINRGSERETFEAVADLSGFGGDGAILTVTDVTAAANDFASVPRNISLILSLKGEINLPFDDSAKPLLGLAQGSDTVQMLTVPAGGTAYEFEWVYADEYDPAGLARDPVRVQSPKPSYTLDLAYPTGNLSIRARAIADVRAPSGGGVAREEGRWSDPLKLAIKTSCGSTPRCINALEPNMNWHFLASYSEGQESTSSLTLYDGALRSRQRQQRQHARGERLIEETAYDREGRGRIKMLGAPAAGGQYRHEPLFNVTAALAPYDHAAFDGQTPPAVANTSGAGSYYSAQGNSASDAYVPDANGYPFLATEPSRDSSARPRRVGGYGSSLALGGGHEALYRYGTASSSPLHRLFGSNVGGASYYQRDVRVDPNGQAQVTYVDRAGHNVVTALA
jgi:hypothetical protein